MPYTYFPAQPAAMPTQYSNASAQQQYFLGPLNAAQAQYLMLYIQQLMRYGSNPPSAPQVQIPSTPTANATVIQSTPPTTTVPLDLVNVTIDASNSSAVESNATSLNASDATPSAAQVPITNLSDSDPDPIVASASMQANPFVSSPSYRVSDWQYNPFASMYANFPPGQPFYPPGFGPWNPFVLTPAASPVSQSNTTQQPTPATSSHSNPEGRSAPTPTVISSSGESGTTDIENLPPQVKEFIDMIPDILSMPETSQLNPAANNAIIHQIGGAESAITPAPLFPKSKRTMRFKKRHFKPARRHANYW